MKEGRGAGHQGGEGKRLGESPHGRIEVQALFRAHARFVASFLRRMGVPAAEVDDLVQEVFLIAHRKGGYEPGAGQPRSWLGAIALRVASTQRRARTRRREEPREAAIEGSVAADDQAAVLETQRALQRVQQALDTLDIEHRAVFVLYEIEGEGCESIAQSLAIPVGTVYSRLHHARKRFLDAHASLAGRQPAVARRRLVEGM